MDWSFNLSVVFTGLFVVFLVLILLVGVVWAMGVIFNHIEETKKAKLKSTSSTNVNDSNTQNFRSDDLNSSFAIDKNISTSMDDSEDLELVACISGCISAIISSEEEDSKGNNYIIKSIKPSPDTLGQKSRPVWGDAGVFDNTKPF